MNIFQKTVMAAFMVSLQLFLSSICSYASENNENSEKIAFSNSVSAEHFSDFLDNEVRTGHKTIGENPSLILNEKFQIYFLLNNSDEKTDLFDLGAIIIPSSYYISANLIYSHNENYAVRYGVFGEFGLGDYKNPFFSAGFGYTHLNDMIFNYIETLNVNNFLKIGYKYDLHLHIDCPPIADPPRDTIRNYYDIDTALGLKKYFPLFLRCNMFFTTSERKTGEKNYSLYNYEHLVSFYHLQYYGDHSGFSAGYSSNFEEYQKSIYINDKYIETITMAHKKSKGGGLTFYVGSSDSSIEVSGEFHLLADNNRNWMTVSKLGVKAFF